MKEAEFWTKYFQSLRFHKEQRVSTISNTQSDDQFLKVASETDKEEGIKTTYICLNKRKRPNCC